VIDVDVFYDKKVFAIAARTGHRAGVYRYARSLQNGLSQIDDIKLRPICSDLLDIPWAWLDLLESEKRYKKRVVSWGQFLNCKDENSSKKIFNYQRIECRNTLKTILEKATETKLYNTINYARLRGYLNPAQTMLFHSPFHLLSKAMGGYKNVICVRTIHDILPLVMPEYFVSDSVRSFRKALNSFGMRDHIICVSNATRRDVVRVLPQFPASHIHVVPLAGDICETYAERGEDWSIFCAHYGIDEDDLICLAVGTIEPRKNHENLVAGFEFAVENSISKNLKLILVGKIGWKAGGIMSRITNSSVSEKIIVLGSIPDILLDCLYRKAVLTLFVSWAEGFGLPVLESMKVGTPVIASPIPIIEETSVNSVYLTDPTSPKAIGGAIIEVIQSSKLQKELSHKGLEHAKRYSWQNTADTTAKVYSKILSG